MTEAARAFVRQRAANRCEYCHPHQNDSPLAALHFEYIRPRKHGGSDDESNLGLACIDCNLHIGSNLTGIDPLTGAVTKLFHPRQQRWEDHFAFEEIYITGRTAVSRTTIQVLDMNSDDQLKRRAAG